MTGIQTDTIVNANFFFRNFIDLSNNGEANKWFESISINLFDVIIIFLVIILNIVILRIIKRFFNKFVIKGRLDEKRKRSLLFFIRIIFWTIVLLIGLSLIGVEISKLLAKDLITFKEGRGSITLSYLIFGILIIVFTGYIIQFIGNFFDRQIRNENIDKVRGRTIFQILKYIIWLIVIILVIQNAGVNLSILLGASAALLVGLGFGLQQIFADIISGIFILFERNLNVDDIIELQDGMVGKVTEIGIRTSKIVSRDNVIHIIPNSQFINDKVINWSHAETRTRFFVNIGVAYGSDIKIVEQTLLEVVAEHKDICKTPIPFVRFNDFGESSLDFQLFFWTRKIFLVENLKSDLRFSIEDKFRINNVQIPFPQRDLHFKSGKLNIIKD
ncbi:mechanosensitive ion channel family protein [Bacteroidota bacterium]